MINKLAGEVRGLKEEQRSCFEQLEHLVEETRGMVEIQMRVLSDRQLESRASLGDTPLTIGSSSFEGMPAPSANQLTNGAILDTEEELAEAGSYIRQLSQPGIQLNSMAMVNVRVKSRISNQESSVDEDELRFERRDTMDARDPAGVTKRLQSLEGEVTEFITPPRKRSQKKRYKQQAVENMEENTTTTTPPGGKGLPRQECIDLVIASQPTVVQAKRQQPSPEEIEVDRSEEDGIEDDRCSGSTRELNDDIEEVGSVSPTCFVTEFGQTEVHFEASDPVDDIGDSL